MNNTMILLAELEREAREEASGLRTDGCYSCCAGTYEWCAEHIAHIRAQSTAVPYITCGDVREAHEAERAGTATPGQLQLVLDKMRETHTETHAAQIRMMCALGVVGCTPAELATTLEKRLKGRV